VELHDAKVDYYEKRVECVDDEGMFRNKGMRSLELCKIICAQIVNGVLFISLKKQWNQLYRSIRYQ
jgi:hypothetical protein